MKKLIIILSLFLASCGEDTSKVTISKEEYDNLRGVKKDVPEYPKKIIDNTMSRQYTSYIIKIDECEYLIYDFGYDNRGLITHKGNCKFCQQRLENTISRKIQEELKKQNEK